jgi:hypothetical protein
MELGNRILKDIFVDTSNHTGGKMFKHIYFDGCNGDQCGECYELEEAVAFLVERSDECSPWTKESARKELQEAIDRNEPLIIDYNGDQQSRLIPS